MPDQQQDEQGDEQQQGDQSQRTADAGGDDGNDVTKLKAALDKERQRARDLEKEVKPLRTFKSERERTEKERQDAERSEIERRDARIAEIEGQLTQAQQRERSYSLRDAIEETVNAADFAHAPRVSPARLIRLLDLGDDDWDGDQPRNVKALLVKLQKAEPDLFVAKSRRTGSADAGEGGRETIAASMNDRIRAMAGRGQI